MESSFWFQGAEWKRRHRVQIWSKNTTRKSQPGVIRLLGEILNDLRARNRNTPHPEGKCFTKPEKERSWPLIVNRCPGRGHVWASARSGAGPARTASPRSCRKLQGTWKNVRSKQNSEKSWLLSLERKETDFSRSCCHAWSTLPAGRRTPRLRKAPRWESLKKNRLIFKNRCFVGMKSDPWNGRQFYKWSLKMF